MPTKLDDIAREANVSTMTVSRALRNSPLVAESTKQRIVHIANKLGYKPDLVARSLATKQSPIIGLIVAELANPFFSPIITAIQDISWESNYFLMIADSERNELNQNAFLEQFKQLRIGGLIITPLSTETRYLEEIRDDGTPVVVIARRWERGDFVSADNVAGGRIVAEHLIQLGHKHFGCISLLEPGHTAAIDRISAFINTVKDAGYDVPDEWILSANSLRIEEGIRVADDFLRLSHRPTAMFVVADRLAVGFIDRLIMRDVRIPEDISVVGYDDIRYSAFLKVPLTSVSLPKEEIGRRAAEILFDRLEDKPVGQPKWQQILLKPKLIVRSSCRSIE